MKKIINLINSFGSQYDELPRSLKILPFILVTIMVMDMSGIISPYQPEKTPYDIQIAKVATIELNNGAIVTMKGYALLDVDAEFEKGDAVYIELTDDCLPSSVRHFYDTREQDGQMYAETKCCGSYPANLVEGKIIDIN